MNRFRNFALAVLLLAGVGIAVLFYQQDDPVSHKEAPTTSRSTSPESGSEAPLLEEPADPLRGDQFRITVTSAETGQPIDAYELAFLTHAPGDADAWVITQSNPSQIWVEVSDAAGSGTWNTAMLEGIEAIGARAKNHAAAWTNISPADREFTLTLEPAASINGRIVTHTGVPLPDAAVAVANRTTTTTAEGRFEIDGLGEGEVVIEADHPEYQSERISLSLSAGKKHDIQLVLKQGGTIVGTVTDGEIPISGAKIAAMNANDPQDHRETISDAKGRFRIAGLSDGEWRLMAASGDQSDTDALYQRAMVETRHETVVDFVFGQTAFIEGVVVLNDRPAADVIVRARSISGYDEQFADTRTNAGGWYKLEIVPGTVQLSAELPGDSPRKKSATVTVSEGTADYDFEFDPPVPFSGRITGVQPGETINIYVLPDGYAIDFTQQTWGTDLSRDALAYAEAGPDGVFSINSLDPGAYALAVLAFTRDASDPLNAARILERALQIQSGGGHVELGFE